MPNLDQVILIDEDNNPIGKIDKVEAHRGEGKLHRAISVFLFNKKGELLIQQRSQKKIVGALEWANTVCGNVRPGESSEECAYRRLKEELGVENIKIRSIYKFFYQVKCNDEFSENEFDEVFVGEYEGEIMPKPDEVANYKWVNFEQLVNNFMRNKSEFKFTPWFEIMLKDIKLVEKIKNNCKFI